MKSRLFLVLILLSFINTIDISILRGEKLFNKNTPIVVNIVSEEIKEKNSNVELICVIDVSGSMMGEKIILVKQSLKVLLEMMGDNDKLGLVLFNHNSEKLLDLTYTTSENKNKILKLIDSIKARGGTYILGGLEIAVNMLKESSNTKSYNSDKFTSSAIILLSDGVDNRMNHLEIGNGLKEITKDSNLGFILHTFGYGNDHDPKIMNTLATIRDGSFYFVQEYKKVAEYFINVLGACVSMISDKAKMSIKTKYKINKIYGLEDLYKYLLQDYYFETELLQVIAGKEYTYVFEIEIPDDKINDNDLIDVEFDYNNKEGNKMINKNIIENMDETNKEKANEEYLRVVVFENMNDAAQLREKNKKKEAEEKLNNMKNWLNANYTGKENYMEDIDGSLELIKNDILYEQQGFATMTSNAREGRMKRGGTSMKYQNAIQRDMVNSLHMA